MPAARAGTDTPQNRARVRGEHSDHPARAAQPRRRAVHERSNGRPLAAGSMWHSPGAIHRRRNQATRCAAHERAHSAPQRTRARTGAHAAHWLRHPAHAHPAHAHRLRGRAANSALLARGHRHAGRLGPGLGGCGVRLLLGREVVQIDDRRACAKHLVCRLLRALLCGLDAHRIGTAREAAAATGHAARAARHDSAHRLRHPAHPADHPAAHPAECMARLRLRRSKWRHTAWRWRRRAVRVAAAKGRAASAYASAIATAEAAVHLRGVATASAAEREARERREVVHACNRWWRIKERAAAERVLLRRHALLRGLRRKAARQIAAACPAVLDGAPHRRDRPAGRCCRRALRGLLPRAARLRRPGQLHNGRAGDVRGHVSDGKAAAAAAAADAERVARAASAAAKRVARAAAASSERVAALLVAAAAEKVNLSVLALQLVDRVWNGLVKGGLVLNLGRRPRMRIVHVAVAQEG